jgi:U3 small nucleolar RNA-associated protein 20
VLRRNEIQQRLLCFLKMFAAINGPRQLYKHELLLSIFTAFLCHQETRVAQTALSCILRYKLPFVLPYADHLQAMLKKGELREALLRFDISKSTGIIMADHRASFIPMMTRILFGRLSSRVSTGKSSKDTPATRRASILSFLSALSEDESELYPLFYLMVRSYVPTGYALKPVEDQTEEDRMRMDELLNSLELNDVAKIPVQRHEGFLNLLSAVVNQLGKGVKFLPCFLSIVVTLCKYSEIKVVNEAPKSDMVGSSENSPANRLGTVRTLCFRRLADCFDQYADSLDFMPYCERLWASVTLSIDCLPSAAATADRAPALLVMLETLSRHASLIRLLLRNEAAVEGVIMCVAPSTQQPVMESTLNFMDNLMTNGGNYHRRRRRREFFNGWPWAFTDSQAFAFDLAIFCRKTWSFQQHRMEALIHKIKRVVDSLSAEPAFTWKR